MPMEDQPLVVVAPIPPDLRAALAERYPLDDRSAWRGRAPEAGATVSGRRVAVTTSMAGATAELFAALPDLGLLACNGTGLDQIDLAAAAARGIAVCHTPDILTEDTAECAVGLIFTARRGIVAADRFVRAGRWMNERVASSLRLAGCSVGVVGLGRIGQAIARRCVGLGLAVAYCGPRRRPECAYPYFADVGDLAEAVDVVVLSCPGGAETHHLVDAAVLARLGPDGTLVNVSRGSVIDEEALIVALQNRTIANAGLDVFASEPDIDPRFHELPNVVLQPHSASITREARAAMVARITGDIAAFLAGRPFFNAAARAA